MITIKICSISIFVSQKMSLKIKSFDQGKAKTKLNKTALGTSSLRLILTQYASNVCFEVARIWRSKFIQG
jgi:hypothetical protein